MKKLGNKYEVCDEDANWSGFNTVQEIAAYIGCSRQTIYNHIRKSKTVYFKNREYDIYLNSKFK